MGAGASPPCHSPEPPLTIATKSITNFVEDSTCVTGANPQLMMSKTTSNFFLMLNLGICDLTIFDLLNSWVKDLKQKGVRTTFQKGWYIQLYFEIHLARKNGPIFLTHPTIETIKYNLLS